MAALLLVFALPSPAHAHGRSASYSTWTLDASGADVRWRVALLDLDAVGGPSPTPDELLTQLELRAGDQVCHPELQSLTWLGVEDGFAGLTWRVTCPIHNAVELRADRLVQLRPSHVHFAHVRWAATSLDRELVLDGRSPTASLSPDVPDSPFFTTCVSHVRVGLTHVLTGWDHLVFLLVLVLGAASLRRVAVVATAFTVGHSLTLALAVTGFVTPSVPAVEALIGATIALVAVENVWIGEDRRGVVLPSTAVGGLVLLAPAVAWAGVIPATVVLGMALFSACYFGLLAGSSRPDRWRWGLAALFGLVHGLAFSSALSPLGLLTAQLAPALVGFNLGVELGQLAVLSVVWLGLALSRHAGARVAQTVGQWASAACLGAGVFWLVNRAF